MNTGNIPLKSRLYISIIILTCLTIVKRNREKEEEFPMKNISRRNFLKGAAAAGVMSAVAATGIAAVAEEATHTYADTIKWDAEYDVVVMGMGASGMVAAKTAADNGARVLIAEKMSEGLAGGNTRVCGQLFAYGNGDKDATVTYYKALAAGREIPDAVVDAISEGVANMADILADEFGFNKDEYVDWTGVDVGGTVLGAMSPEYPEMPGSEKIGLWTTHAGVSDSYLFNGLKDNVLARADKIDVWYESPAVKILQDPESKIVVGVQVERGGQTLNVRALNGVCVTTGGFETNPDMIQQYLGIINYAARGGQYNTGDGIRMAQAVGADLWHMSCYEGLFGLGSITWPVEIGTNCAQPATLTHNCQNTGAVILVGTDGNRFVNESEMVRHGHLYENGIWENATFPEKVFLIYDKTQYDLVKESGLMGDFISGLVEYDSIEAMAEGTGCKPDTLKATIEAFNSFATNGVDYKCGREAEYMRPFDGEKYYAMYVIQGLLNTQGGPRRNENAEIIDLNGEPIPHLYGAGECGGVTVCMYQGGTNIAECITFGRIAGRNAAAAKDPLPAYTAGEVVESTPAQPGEITDVAKEVTYETGDNQYIGVGQGIGGDVVTRVTYVDGKITDVEVLANSETAGIGSVVIDDMPAKFVGLSTAEEVAAVETTSGATITSNALKDAVTAALQLVK